MFSLRYLYHWHIVKSINNTCSIIMLLFPSQNCLKLQTSFKESSKVYHLLSLQDNIFCWFFLVFTPLLALFVLDFSYNLANIWAAQNESFIFTPFFSFNSAKKVSSLCGTLPKCLHGLAQCWQCTKRKCLENLIIEKKNIKDSTLLSFPY